jgi:OOP family OmpA-OmpF porin
LGFGHGGVDKTLPAFGGIVGAKLVPALGIEARGSFLSTNDLDNLDITHGEGNLTAFLAPGKRLVPLLTAGAGAVRAKNDDGSDDTFAWNAGGGFLVRFNDEIGVRVDARYVSYKVVDFEGDDGWRPHTEIFAGLSLGLGGKPRDTDLDGVPDRDDSCPHTPVGARVDLRGCPVDGDKDGVPDGLDRCEPTPLGAKVDARGCPIDTDGDGVFDGIDTCPDTPARAVVDPAGCPVDTDGDGVFDGLDQCAGTPKGCVVDASGCQADADKDGVCDGLDQCPDTPSDVRTDAKGCPIVVTEKETELLETGMIRLQNVNFESGKAKLQPESYPALDEVGNILSRWPDLRIEIGGHTDSQGSDEFNQKLSEDRAKSVLIYLISKFPDLKPEQLTSAGYGESAPIAPNDTALNRAKNRRVEFKVLNTEALRRETEKTKLAPKN